jgi:PPOX class probable F420-dependent enzyme
VKSTLSPEARAFLQERRFAVLATINHDGTPHLSTMWYLLEGDTIVMNTKVGRVKERNMRRDPRISLCFEDGYNYITLSGTVEFIDDQKTAQADIYHLAVRYDGEESAKQQMQESFGKEQRVTLRLKFDHVIERLEE